MAVLPQDRRGQTLMALALAAGATGYFAWAGTPIGGVHGVSQLGKTRDSLQVQIDSIETAVRRAKLDVRHGTVQQLQRRLDEYRATLDLMRMLVPASGDVPNLLDDISSRSKMRGANLITFAPQPVESGSPFDTQRFRFTITGNYDQVSELLADIASLSQIIVPYDVHLERIQSPTADSTLRASGVLQVSFQIRTFVKPAPGDTMRARRAQPARPGAQPARPGAQPAAPRAGAHG